jgi:hypothetical protein
MQTENKTLPSSDSKNISRRVPVVTGAYWGGFLSQCTMATAPMPKRIQASSNTGSAMTKGFDRAT